MSRLNELVTQSGMTTERIASAAGCPRPFLDDVLAGRREWIHPDVLRDLARVFHTYPEAILSGSLDAESSLAGRILTLRRERGFSQKTLAKKMEALGAGVHHAQVRRWERATSHPNETNLEALAQVLGVSVNYLRFGSDVPPLPVRTRSRVQVITGEHPRLVRGTLIAVSGSIVAALALFVMGVVPHGGPGASEALQVRVTNEGHTLQAANPVTHEPLWSRDFTSCVKEQRTTPWNGRNVLMAGLDQSGSEQAGGFLVYEMGSWTPIVEDFPDASSREHQVALLGRAGADMRMIWRGYNVVAAARIFADLDGDGRDELLVPFASNYRNGPSEFRVYGDDGSRRGDFFVSGRIEYHLAADVDNDGKDEILLSTTSANPRERGFSLILLDDQHLNGVSPDARRNPACRLPEGALRGVTFPAFDESIMGAIGSLHLSAWQTELLPQSGPGGARYLVWIGADPATPLVLYLDEDLRTVRVTYSDVFAADMNGWPADIRDRFLGGYLEEWGRSAVRFGEFDSPSDDTVATGAEADHDDVPRR